MSEAEYVVVETKEISFKTLAKVFAVSFAIGAAIAVGQVLWDRYNTNVVSFDVPEPRRSVRLNKPKPETNSDEVPKDGDA